MTQPVFPFPNDTFRLLLSLREYLIVVTLLHRPVLLQSVKHFNLLNDVVAYKREGFNGRPICLNHDLPFAIISSILLGSLSFELFEKTFLQVTRNFSGLTGYSRPRYWRCLYSAITRDLCVMSGKSLKLRKTVFWSAVTKYQQSFIASSSRVAINKFEVQVQSFE